MCEIELFYTIIDYNLNHVMYYNSVYSLYFNTLDAIAENLSKNKIQSWKD